MKASDLFVKALENEGVEYIFGLPGEENLDLLESLRKSKIKFIVARHEQAAGFMAATYGRLTGKAGVALSTLGPGATNFVTAAAYAQLGGMPALFITGQKPIKKSKQGHFQIVATSDILRPVTKYTKVIISADAVAARVREAFRLAQGERPGAVHLELPEDIASDETEAKPFNISKGRRPVAEEKAITKAVGMIEAAKSPLILVGAGANRNLISKMLSQFIDESGIPFFNTQMGKGVVNENHPLYIGTAALSADDFVHCAIAAADLIINVGHDVIEKPPFFMDKTGRQKVIHINYLSAAVDEIYFPQLEVTGDIANALWQIKQRLKKQTRWNFKYFLGLKDKLDAHLREKADSDSFPVYPQRLVRDVREILSADDIVTLDNGMYKLWFARNYRAEAPNTLLLDNALATMGAGLPSAIAAGLVYPRKKILAVAGDGGFMMNSQELETAVREKIDLVVLIVNDGGYGMIKWKQAGMGFRSFGLNYKNPDFVKYAESYGAKGHRVARARDLQKYLGQSFAAGGVHLIDVPIDYAENKKVFDEELKKLTCDL